MYFGDHITADVVVTRKRSPWQAFAIVEEALSESRPSSFCGRSGCAGIPSGGADGGGGEAGGDEGGASVDCGVSTWGSFFECRPAASRSGEAGFSKNKKTVW